MAVALVGAQRLGLDVAQLHRLRALAVAVADGGTVATLLLPAEVYDVDAFGHADGVVAAGWPEADDAAAKDESIEIPVQVNGKVRGRVTVEAGASEDAIKTAALAAPSVTPHLEGKQVVKVILAGGKLVSVVVK